MIQLSETGSPIDSRPDSLGKLGDRDCDEGKGRSDAKLTPFGSPEAAGPTLFVSPPPVPWPRIFPSL